METTKVIEEDVVIVGAGIAGLCTALGLHRLGVRSLVLECSDSLRVTGFGLAIWENAWKALDAVGVGDILRHKHIHLYGNVATSLIKGQQIATTSFRDKEKLELRCVRRKLLLEALASELPSGTIRYLSKVVAVEVSGFSKVLHLHDGTTIKTKVLIGCDGVNSVVAKWLGFKEATYTGRYAIRGCAELENHHNFEPVLMHFFGKGFRAGVVPCDEKIVHWFFTWTPTIQDKELIENPAKLKEYVLSKLEKMPSDVRYFIEKTELDAFQSTPLRYRHPWELIMGNISKDNVCVVGDALHPMTPDLGQGGCCALEDGVVLARCLAEAFSKKPMEEEEQFKRIEEELKKYANERRWRCIDLIATSYIVGFIQQ
ncbi:FAD-dependent urate hydroxylase-like protein, partial [Trifolium pratense]